MIVIVLLVLLVLLLFAYLVYSCVVIRKNYVEKRRMRKMEEKEGILLREMDYPDPD